MIIGIDVGGTHTDGILLREGEVIETSKVPTQRAELTQSILEVLDNLLVGEDQRLIRRIVFSTTLTTNLIAQGDLPATGLVLISGPGLSPDWLKLGTENWLLSGSIDHRGRMVAELNALEVAQMIQELQNSGIRDLAIVGKFSTRNPQQEESLASQIRQALPKMENIQLGNQVAPRLNFPRRVQTTWLNTAVYGEYARFLESVQTAIRQREIQADLYLLKADGGTMPMEEGLTHGVETIKSGPAASIMGFLALASETQETALLLDVGGTTTDIAFMTGGTPLFEPEGVQIEGYLTAVRGLLNRSLPYGGDSRVVITETGEVDLLGRRVGPAMIFGGEQPTLTDALAIAGLVRVEIGPALLEKAQVAMESLVPDQDGQKTADLAIEAFYSKVEQAVQELLNELNGQPVYTIHELLEGDPLRPQVVMMIGGPAEGLLPGLAEKLQMIPLLPKYHHVANALGAAVARPTLSQSLYADTAQGFYRISGRAGQQRVSRGFSQHKAEQVLLAETAKVYRQMTNEATDPELIEITHAEVFNIVRGYSTQGKIIKLEAQIKPGVSSRLAPIRATNSTMEGGNSHATDHS